VAASELTPERIAEIVADACLLADRDSTTKYSSESAAESVERGVKEMRAEIDALRTERDALWAADKDNDAEIARLQRAIAAWRAERDVIRAENERLRTDLTAALHQLAGKPLPQELREWLDRSSSCVLLLRGCRV